MAGDYQPPAVHALAHAMNQALGNIGTTVTYGPAIEPNPISQHASLAELATAMDAGQVQVLVILGNNPVIRVVGLVPGLIVPSREEMPPEAVAKTDATVPLGRAGLPVDLAGPAVFLASDDAAYMTGSFVTVDGGVLFQQRSPQVETFPLERFPSAP